jgi:hypothetical protein
MGTSVSPCRKSVTVGGGGSRNCLVFGSARLSLGVPRLPLLARLSLGVPSAEESVSSAAMAASSASSAAAATQGLADTSRHVITRFHNPNLSGPSIMLHLLDPRFMSSMTSYDVGITGRPCRRRLRLCPALLHQLRQPPRRRIIENKHSTNIGGRPTFKLHAHTDEWHNYEGGRGIPTTVECLFSTPPEEGEQIQRRLAMTPLPELRKVRRRFPHCVHALLRPPPRRDAG